MKVLTVGDIFGSPGRKVFGEVARAWKDEGKADFIVVNGENAAAGRGINPKQVKELLEAGADVVTLGDHAWDQRELMEYIDTEPRLIRPANMLDAPGKGHHTVSSAAGNLTVISLIGRVFMNFPFPCPFHEIDLLLGETTHRAKAVLVEMHAEATSEKQAMGYHLDGRVSAVVGTHTHVQTSDSEILPKGTAYLTDLGMTGPHDSVIGSEVAGILRRFRTGLPVKFTVASERVRLEGALLDIDSATGLTRSIETVRIPATG